MAHFVIYKRPAEVTQYQVDFSELMDTSDTALDTDETKVTVFDTLEADKSSYFIQKLIFSGLKVTAVLVNGLDGEDYLVYYDAVGNVSKPNLKINRILEVRVRSKLSGNL